MKKIVYTAALFALFAVTGNAQSNPQEPKKEAQPAKSAQPKKEEKAPAAEQPKSGTRMAINEKGVPASKAGATKEKKEEKPASPGQPTAAEKH